MRHSIRIAVLGGAGAMGRVAVRALTNYAEVDHIILADYHEQRAHEVAATLKDEHKTTISVHPIDVRDEARLRDLIRGADVVLNAVEYVFNLPILKACIAEHVHYADLGGLFHKTREQLNLNAEAEAAGITALLGMGGTPGVTNLLARKAVDQLDHVESIKVQLGCSDSTPSQAPLVAPYSIRTILDEFTRPPQVYQDGAWHEQKPLSGQEVLDFSPPVGYATAAYSLHSECATFPLSFREKGIRHVSFKIAFPSDFMAKLKFLVDLGLAQEQPVTVNGTQVAPRDLLIRLLESFPAEQVEPRDCDVLRVVATGMRGAQRIEIINQVVVLPYQRWGISAGALDTGVPLAIAGVLLARGEITHRGACGPELCVPLDSFFRELARYNMHVETFTSIHTDASV